ncbi:MAG: antibiotic biosynthesis monooxygenase [Gammaproteobacteria bacterium]|nr:MAG: antibiotic biosynthesis monooxygenase [Gammaproteobacteria bacterium]
MLDKLPQPPYYAVIFSSLRGEPDEAYSQTAARMMQLAQQQTGFIGVDSIRDGRSGITVSYWQDETSILQWKQNSEHLLAQRLGREKWYECYQLHIARVERSYEFRK